jgi:hypothetical protein
MANAQPTGDDSSSVPSAARGAERRRRQRFRVEAHTPLTATSRGRIYACELRDISLDGIRLSFRSEMPTGNVIALDHPIAGILCGVCAWRSEGDMGVELQLPRAELERALKCISLVI